jgi:hypothetical protein
MYKKTQKFTLPFTNQHCDIKKMRLKWSQAYNLGKRYKLMYRTSGVIFFIDYCTAVRDT